MIDIHTHILPNIDDGSRSIDETFNLLKEAQEAGFDKVVLTSHYMEGYYETDSKERDVWLNAIYKNLSVKDIKVDLYLGNEIYMSENIIKLLEDGKASTINDTSYVLFEMPLNAEPFNLYDIIYQMQQCKVVPILAHPERYEFIKKDPELIYDLIKKGVLMQANYGSIIGQYGEKTRIMVTKLLKNDMIHMLGTDVHRQKTIYQKMPECLEKIEKIVGKEKLEILTTINPNLVLNNKRIDIEEPIEIEYTFKDKFEFMTGEKLKKIFGRFITK